MMEEKKVNEVAVGGGGVSVAVTRFPTEQKRPLGPLVVVGVRDGVLWLIDRYKCILCILYKLWLFVYLWFGVPFENF